MGFPERHRNSEQSLAEGRTATSPELCCCGTALGRNTDSEERIAALWAVLIVVELKRWTPLVPVLLWLCHTADLHSQQCVSNAKWNKKGRQFNFALWLWRSVQRSPPATRWLSTFGVFMPFFFSNLVSNVESQFILLLLLANDTKNFFKSFPN